MPRWGLVEDLVNAPPWGIPASLLEPAKTNTDPIHEEIYLNKLETLIIDSPAFQRLRRVRQLGTTHLVYPGATHTRFQHSTGALRVVQDLFDHLVDNPISRRRGDDLISSWRGSKDYGRHLGEAIVLARLGALLHDFCHVAYGHTIEDDFELLVPHDKNTERFDEFWSSMPEPVQKAVTGELKSELTAIVLSKRKPAPASRYPFVQDLVGNTICADLIDYLWRDYYFTGLPGRLGKRFLSYFFVTAKDAPDLPQRMALRIVKNGRPRSDVITEVFKYLRYRYELGERALQHHAKISADNMIGKAVGLWLERDGKEKVERALRMYGDDGLLERLAEDSSAGIKELAVGVRDRRLYKEARSARRDAIFIRREKLYAQWGSAAKRKAVEEKAAKAVELRAPWHVLLSVPNPGMRLKAADVLVSTDEAITPLREWDREHGRKAQEIYDSHERLWAIQLFVHPDVTQRDRARVAAYVAEEMKISWDPGPQEALRSPVVEQAIEELAWDKGLDERQQAELREAVHRQAEIPGGEKFGDVKARLERLLPAKEPATGNLGSEKASTKK